MAQLSPIITSPKKITRIGPITARFYCLLHRFRFQKTIREWTDENLKDQNFDFICFAGATRELDTILGQSYIFARLHSISQAVLLHHEECRAHGGESTFEKHSADLLKTKPVILARYPQFDVSLFYLKISGEFIPDHFFANSESQQRIYFHK